MINGNIDSAVSGREFGIGIRIFKGFKSVYAYTNDKSLKGMLETAYKASCAIGELKEHMLVQTQLLGTFH
ncbi:protein TldD [Clostridium putrefaciens]|uniref:Protein TldD n=1 Tax=Clostridium putrefaciens TaxID=99675 RepID=A0A381JBZ5_9CLOT|nr:DNA gyrase modulator [Clostridium putrefaciens]SUY47907.1 protein TldD [Clostridium putrefaciens]